ncbi:hypothetical protein BDR26DRAFT_1009865 [Obelidium mucronatum]|nr:hypothetical protein BDR26DRAFT_1009865 [Obelidium mucronatum]
MAVSVSILFSSFDSINAVMDEEKKKERDEKKVAAAVKKQQQEVDRASYAANSNGAEKTSANQQGGKRTYIKATQVRKPRVSKDTHQLQGSIRSQDQTNPVQSFAQPVKPWQVLLRPLER